MQELEAVARERLAKAKKGAPTPPKTADTVPPGTFKAPDVVPLGTFTSPDRLPPLQTPMTAYQEWRSRNPISGRDKNNYRYTDLSENAARAEAGTSEQAKKAGEVREIRRAAELAMLAGVESERNTMHEAQAKYLSAYKEYYSKHRLLPRFKQDPKLNELKTAYQKTQAEYASKLLASARERLNERYGKDAFRKEYDEGVKGIHGVRDAKGRPMTYEQFHEAQIQKRLDRYKGIVQFNDVIKPGIEKERAAKLEAVQSKEKGAAGLFLKGAGWALRKNAELTKSLEEGFGGLAMKAGMKEEHAKRMGKFGARAARLFVTTAAFTGLGMATGGLGYAAAGLYTGQRVLRGLGSMAIGSTGGYIAGKAYEATGGKQAAEKHATSRRGEISSVADIERQTRDAKHGSREAIERKRTVVETGTAALLSFGVAAEQAHEMMKDAQMKAAAEQLAKAAQPHVPEIAVAHKGEGAYALFHDLQEKLKTNGADSPLAKQLLTYTNAHDFVNKLHMVKHGESIIIPEGASFSIEHDALVYKAPNHEAITLIAKDSHGEYAVKTAFDKIPWDHYQHHGSPHVEGGAQAASFASHVEATSATPTSSSSEDEIARIYAAERAHNGFAPGWDKAPTVHEVANGTYSASHPDALRAATPATAGEHLQSPTVEPARPMSTPSDTFSPPQAPASTHESLTGSLMQGEVYAQAKSDEVLGMFETPTPPGDDIDKLYRLQLFETLTKSGVGPHEHETLQHYLERASAHVSDTPKMHIVQTPDNHVLVRGGDMDAQLTLAREHFRTHHVPVLVENNSPRNPGYIVVGAEGESGIPNVQQTPTLKLSDVKGIDKARIIS